MNTCSCTSVYAEGQYILPELPYTSEELAPLLDADTLCLHHDRHHAAYVKGANEAAATLSAIARGERPLSEAPYATQQLTFNLSGHVLHSVYWKSISPEPQSGPMGELARSIQAEFGSTEDFLRLFRSITLSIQGNGWGVLGVDSLSRRLMICAVLRHQDALVAGFRPLMVCDVWEHAYYLRYRNDRVAYVDAFLRHLDWEGMSLRYNKHCCRRHEQQD